MYIRYSDAVIARARKMVAAGASRPSVARKLGTAATAIYAWCKGMRGVKTVARKRKTKRTARH